MIAMGVCSCWPDGCEKVCECFSDAPLWAQSSCRNILTVPFTGPGVLSSPPMTKRSILPHQRCQPPLCKQTIRRRGKRLGWTMLEMTAPGLTLPLSATFPLYYSWRAAGQRSEPLLVLSQSPKFHPFMTRRPCFSDSRL